MKDTTIWFPTELSEGEIKKIYNLCIDGLLTDGDYHKQWFLEQIFVTSGVKLKDLRLWLQSQGYDFDDGTAP